MTQEELDIVIKLHGMWLRNEEDGEQADFNKEDAHGLCFENANLNGAVIRDSNFANANFNGACFEDAYIKNSVFKYASMKSCEWRKTRIVTCNMAGVKMSGSTFADTNFNTVCLSYADISYTMLGDTLFRNCVFDKADFSFSNLLHIVGVGNKFDDANLTNALIPEIGCFSWKVYAGGVPPIYNIKYQAGTKNARLVSYDAHNEKNRAILRGLVDMVGSKDLEYAVELVQALIVS